MALRSHQSPRYVELDSLRGLAALLVMFNHLLLSFTWSASVWDALLYKGTDAVRFFFILSGFVLALPYLRGPVPAPGFLIKRVLRLWPPYAVAIAFSGLMLACFPWKDASIVKDAWLWGEYVLLVNRFDYAAFNVVVWSLQVEMRVSLIFPLLMRWYSKAGRGAIVWVVILSAIGIAGQRVLPDGIAYWLGHLNFVAMFLLGALLAKHRESLVSLWSRLGERGHAMGLILALALFTYGGAIVDRLHHGLLAFFLHEWIVCASAALFIIAALTPGNFQAWLRQSIPSFLGRISYSLYLLHCPVFLALAHHSEPFLPKPVAAALGVAIAIALAWLSYTYIERPTIFLGHALARRSAENPVPTLERAS